MQTLDQRAAFGSAARKANSTIIDKINQSYQCRIT